MARYRRRSIPAEAAAVVPERERGLAAGVTPAGEYVVATDRALYVPQRGGHVRVGYEDVQTAAWDDPVLELTLLSGGSTSRQVLRLQEPGEVPPTLRERVTASIVVTERVPLAGPLGARIIARRVPGENDVRWQVVFEQGLDPSDPGLRQRADEAIERLKESTGL
jgi:hypothetical protein